MRSERYTVYRDEVTCEDEREKADNNDENERNLGRALKLFCASVLKLCFTGVELFVLPESSYGVDFALQFGKAWDRIFVGREFYNTFVLIRDSGLCLSVKNSLQRTHPSFRLNKQ